MEATNALPVPPPRPNSTFDLQAAADALPVPPRGSHGYDTGDGDHCHCVFGNRDAVSGTLIIQHEASCSKRQERLEAGAVLTLYHQTNPTAGAQIKATGFRPGSKGLAGGAVRRRFPPPCL